jgi:hypothetical protein
MLALLETVSRFLGGILETCLSMGLLGLWFVWILHAWITGRSAGRRFRRWHWLPIALVLIVILDSARGTWKLLSLLSASGALSSEQRLSFLLGFAKGVFRVLVLGGVLMFIQRQIVRRCDKQSAT